jgi:anti-sigma B factor antagonist/stage II sporulation protein AA (anti-sigma F factor antagonist)
MDSDRTVRLTGDIDLAVKDHLTDELRRGLAAVPTGGRLVIDLREVDFMDSTGLSCVAEIAGAARASGRSVCLRGPRPVLRRALEITGFDGLVEPSETAS